MFNKMKFTAQCFLASYKAAKSGPLYTPGHKDMYVFEGVNVVHSDEALKINGRLGAICVNTAFGYVIVVDDFFVSLMPVAQQFVLYHEIGHTKASEFSQSLAEENKSRKRLITEGSVSQSEKDADLYAYQMMGGRALIGLYDLLDSVKEYCGFKATVKELELRLEHLMQIIEK